MPFYVPVKNMGSLALAKSEPRKLGYMNLLLWEVGTRYGVCAIK